MKSVSIGIAGCMLLASGLSLADSVLVNVVGGHDHVLADEPDEVVSVYVMLQGDSVVRALGESAQVYSSPSSHSLQGVTRVRAQQHLAVLRGQHAAMRARIEGLGGVVTADLMRLANVMQVRVARSKLAQIASLPGVVSLEPVPWYEPLLGAAVPWVNAPQVWERLGATGRGMKIGIADTGIDYLHRHFGGTGSAADFAANDSKVIEPGTFPTEKVVGGWDFVGDNYGNGIAVPDPDPLDCAPPPLQAAAGGHGTHVAGIAAGYGVDRTGNTYRGPYGAALNPASFSIFPGVAPEALLYALRIFGCEGGTNMVAAAIEWAMDPNKDGDLSDRLDVLNLSLGGDYGIHSRVEQELFRNASQAGMLVVAAAGNSGNVHFIAGEPSTHPDVVSVAASVTGARFQALQVTPQGGVARDFASVEGAFSRRLLLTGPVADNLVATEPADACADLANAAQLRGKVAYIERGDCYFEHKVQRAEQAGAVAAVITNRQPNEALFVMGGVGAGTNIPAVMISKESGDVIGPWLRAGSARASLDPARYVGDNSRADQPAGFTSRGPNANGALLKPDLSMPGVGIFSARVGTGAQGYAASGTSMATPMAVGAAALLRQQWPALTPREVKARMMNTAVVMPTGLGDPVPLSIAGAGRVDVRSALETRAVAYDAQRPELVSLSFGALAPSERLEVTRQVEIRNYDNRPMKFSLEAKPSYQMPGARLQLAQNAVTVPAGGTARVSAALVLEPQLLPLAQRDPYTPSHIDMGGKSVERVSFNEFGGHIVLTSATSTLRVPFYAAVRAGDKRHATTQANCGEGKDVELEVALEGTTTHDNPVVSVLELGGVSPRWDAVGDRNPVDDILETGVTTDLATVGNWSNAHVYFALSVAGEWTTPARGYWSPTLVHIDTDLDGSADYYIWLSPMSMNHYGDVLVASVRDRSYSSQGESIVSFGPRDKLNTEVYNNSVLVVPVRLRHLGKLNASHPTFAYRVVSAPFPPYSMTDSSPWHTFDPTKAWLDAASYGYGRSPVFRAADSVKVKVQRSALGEKGKALLFVHHTNEAGQRVQVMKMSDIPISKKSDLEVRSSAPASMDRDQEVTWPVQVKNGSTEPAFGIVVKASVLEDASVVGMQTDAGSCKVPAGAAHGECEIATLAAGQTAVVNVTVKSGKRSFAFTATVEQGAGCEIDPSNNTQSSSITVISGEQPEDGGLEAETGEDGGLEAETGEDGGLEAETGEDGGLDGEVGEDGDPGQDVEQDTGERQDSAEQETEAGQDVGTEGGGGSDVAAETQVEAEPEQWVGELGGGGCDCTVSKPASRRWSAVLATLGLALAGISRRRRRST